MVPTLPWFPSGASWDPRESGPGAYPVDLSALALSPPRVRCIPARGLRWDVAVAALAPVGSGQGRRANHLPPRKGN